MRRITLKLCNDIFYIRFGIEVGSKSGCASGSVVSMKSDRNITRTSPHNLLAGVLTGGDEANVGGYRCEFERSAIASATMLFLEPNVWCDEVRT